MNSTTEQWRTNQWEATLRPDLAAAPESVVPHTVSFYGEDYSPDLTFIVLGTGAAHRLAEYLNARRDLETRAAAAEAKAARLQRMLEDLTPGGSDFYGSPDNCVRFIKGRLDTAASIAAERNALRQKVDALSPATGEGQ